MSKVMWSLVVAAVAISGGVLATMSTLRAIQIVLGVGVVVVAFAVDRNAKDIPAILRPAPAMMLGALASSLSIELLTDNQYDNAYFGMWLCQMVGFLLAIPVWGNPEKPIKAASRSTDVARLATLASIVWWVGAACAVFFLGTQGVPLLADSVEQGRVDIAVTGTGYIRLLAYMTGPAAVVIFATGHRRRWLYMAATAAIIVLFANRIPIVYLGAPVVAMAAVVGTRLRSRHLVAVAAIALVVVGMFGAYRVMNQPDFLTYDEYRSDLAQGDRVGIAVTTVTQYARVVPANAVLVKRLVDGGRIDEKLGASYLTLFVSALPGEQLSPDLEVKEASGAMFVGGGTPPTLMGEGYMNFGYPGIIMGAFVTMGLARYWAAVAIQTRGQDQQRVSAAIYGYVITWCVAAQVGGLAGAATIPLAGFLLLIGLRWLSRATAAGVEQGVPSGR